MSYKITIYCDDSTISVTKAVVYDGIGQTHTAKYSAQGVYTASGINGTTKFTATAAEGCSFVEWEYWIGTPEGSPYSSSSKEFTYTYEQDIYIRAIGKYEKVETDWMATSSFSLDLIDDVKQSAALFDYKENEAGLFPKTIHSGHVSFTRNGYAHFYTTGDVDTLGYLSDSPNWNRDYSGPQSYLASDDNGKDGHNFDIVWYVEADKDYYLFVRGRSGTEEGEVTVHVTEPWEFDDSSLGYPEDDYRGSEISYPFTLHRREMSFSKSGKLTINVAASLISDAWISTSPDWDYNAPTDVLDGIPVGAEDSVFLECDVVANETYYLWFRNNTSTMALFLYIIYAVEASPPAKWDWNKSNGSATDTETFNAFWAAEYKGATSDFSHWVWNDIVDKVQAFLDYTERGSWTIGSNNYGYPESTTYTDLLSAAQMDSSDTKLYALKFNIVRFCIGVMATFNNATENNLIYQHYVNTGSWDMVSGEEVLGGYILALTNKINQI